MKRYFILFSFLLYPIISYAMEEESKQEIPAAIQSKQPTIFPYKDYQENLAYFRTLPPEKRDALAFQYHQVRKRHLKKNKIEKLKPVENGE